MPISVSAVEGETTMNFEPGILVLENIFIDSHCVPCLQHSTAMTHERTITAQTNVQLQLIYMGQVSSSFERGCEAGRFYSSEDCVCCTLM